MFSRHLQFSGHFGTRVANEQASLYGCWRMGLQPIENIWHILKGIMYARCPRVLGTHDMAAPIQEAGNHISSERLPHFMNSIPNGIQAILVVNGGHTR